MVVTETANGADVAAGPVASAGEAAAVNVNKTTDFTAAAAGINAHPTLGTRHNSSVAAGFLSNAHQLHRAADPRPATVAQRPDMKGSEREMKDLEELLSKLNPMAAEFIPPSIAGSRQVASNGGGGVAFGGGFFANGFSVAQSSGNGGVFGDGSRRGRRRISHRTSLAQRDEVIRRTVYVADIDHQVTEEELAALFINCGQVVDCRMCGDPKTVLHFAFIEFTDEEGARAALDLSGTMLGFYPVRVLPSKTAIAPVNPTFLPRSDDEREMCSRTVYCTNIDKKRRALVQGIVHKFQKNINNGALSQGIVSQAEVRLFFESLCGEVYRLRLLGDYHHSTRIAFVEFVMAESATAALNCSGVVLGSFPIRVSPSKTPVRPRSSRAIMH